VVDLQPILRFGLKERLEREGDLEITGEADSVETGIEAVERLAPEIVILDLLLKGASGIDLIKKIKHRAPQISMLVFSAYDESLYAERALRAGARGYLMKQECMDQIITALRTVQSKEVYVSDEMGAKMLSKMVDGRPASSSPIDRLSDRELEVFQLIGQGLGTRQIAERLHLSIKTIESYRAHIKDKLNLRTAMELVHHAIQWSGNEAAKG
jgi:DNA-binding NarL/FixJ family response regulator